MYHTKYAHFHSLFGLNVYTSPAQISLDSKTKVVSNPYYGRREKPVFKNNNICADFFFGITIFFRYLDIRRTFIITYVNILNKY